MEESIYFKATISDRVVFVQTTTTLIPRLFDFFMDNGYTVEKMEGEDYQELLKNGEVVYYAKTSEIVDEFINNTNKIKEIRNGN